MKTDAQRMELDQLTERVIGCAFEVSNTLGCGFLEKFGCFGSLLPKRIDSRGFGTEVPKQRKMQSSRR